MRALDPNTLAKLRRFRRQRVAWFSFRLLGLIFAISLFSELIANRTPWRVRLDGQNLYPWFTRLTQDDLLADGVMTAPDYHAVARDARFTANPENRMWWTLVPYGPDQTLRPDQIELSEALRLGRLREQRVGTVQILAPDRLEADAEASLLFAGDTWSFAEIPSSLRTHIEARFRNEPAPAAEAPDATGAFHWSVSAYQPRSRAPRSVRLLLRETVPVNPVREFLPLSEDLQPVGDVPAWWEQLADADRERILALADAAKTAPVKPIAYADAEGVSWQVSFERETVQFPFRPVKGHPLGLDESGRDVLVQILYATRISLLFGFILVISSMVLGTLIGALQGYFGGWLDLIGQRLIEIYESIPFLYVMIFLGSVFGKSFGLLLLVYAIFNWIGISYYMRAEFLKLRSQPFTEAARALGLPAGRIMWVHILPNALVPILTFFPFMLVGAIGSLGALDFLGFGLPVGTPSWGELLRQAQSFRSAWWLILYPSLALFVVILLGVFIGEGLRAAFDPKRETHWEA